MTTADPPRDTGLRGELYLSEHVETQGYTPTDLHAPGVYALRCSVPDDVPAAWDAQFETRPSYVADIVQAQRTVYVGAAQDVYDRLRDHVDGEVRQAALLQVCPPHSLVDVWLCDDPFTKESGIAIDLQNKHDDWYIHSR